MQDNELIDLIDNRLLPAWKEAFKAIQEKSPCPEKTLGLHIKEFSGDANPSGNGYYGRGLSFSFIDGNSLVERLSRFPKKISPEEQKANLIAQLKAEIEALEAA
jgi:hypothetical protein